jgi:hypothetical protein
MPNKMETNKYKRVTQGEKKKRAQIWRRRAPGFPIKPLQRLRFLLSPSAANRLYYSPVGDRAKGKSGSSYTTTLQNTGSGLYIRLYNPAISSAGNATKRFLNGSFFSYSPKLFFLWFLALDIRNTNYRRMETEMMMNPVSVCISFSLHVLDHIEKKKWLIWPSANEITGKICNIINIWPYLYLYTINKMVPLWSWQ